MICNPQKHVILKKKKSSVVAHYCCYPKDVQEHTPSFRRSREGKKTLTCVPAVPCYTLSSPTDVPRSPTFQRKCHLEVQQLQIIERRPRPPPPTPFGLNPLQPRRAPKPTRTIEINLWASLLQMGCDTGDIHNGGGGSWRNLPGVLWVHLVSRQRLKKSA